MSAVSLDLLEALLAQGEWQVAWDLCEESGWFLPDDVSEAQHGGAYPLVSGAGHRANDARSGIFHTMCLEAPAQVGLYWGSHSRMRRATLTRGWPR